MKIGQEVFWEYDMSSSCIDTSGVSRWYGKVISFDDKVVCVIIRLMGGRESVAFVNRELIHERP